MNFRPRRGGLDPLEVLRAATARAVLAAQTPPLQEACRVHEARPPVVVEDLVVVEEVVDH